MHLIVILLALAGLQLWGARNPLHRDTAFYSWVSLIGGWNGVNRFWWLRLLVVLLAPVVTVAVLAAVLPVGFWLVLATVVLLYSLGRGEFAPETTAYTLACNDGAWDVALVKAQKQGVDVQGLAQSDWPSLHQRMLEATAYQGFERLFAVIFWFLFFGPAGALLYRLSFLYSRIDPENLGAHRWLWALEWVPVRLLGASFAITGNFVGCINHWKRHAASTSSPSASVLRETVLGALSVDDELMQSCDCTQREISALKRLYARTLWFWVTCLALWILLQS
jgi:AmpE protein